jgi:superfamily II DNA/RNA helicase
MTTSTSGNRGARRRNRRPGTERPQRIVEAAFATRTESSPSSVLPAEPVPAKDYITDFVALGVPAALIKVLADRDVLTAFPIQSATLPDSLQGYDVLGRGKTGSGKTIAFALPLVARLAASGKRRESGRPRALILVPTRELANQVMTSLSPLAAAMSMRVATIYGGVGQGPQVSALRHGVDIVVACPGRLEDLIGQRHCRLDAVEVTVLDEADHMADLGFLPVVTEILGMTPADGQRLLFSATLDRGVDKLVRQFLNDPAMHAVASDASHVELMDHRVFAVSHDSKVEIAAEIAARPGRTLIFVRTKHGADRLALQLRRTGVEAGAIHGNLTQNARKKALDAFSRGSARVLVATDVAARGIHVDDVDLVVHYDPPADHKDYLHRSGRTARAGASGTVLSLLLSDQVRENQRMRERAGVDANAQSVTPGHPAVREIAESGEPIVVQAPPAYTQRPATSSAPRRNNGGGRPYRPSSSSGGSGGRATSGRPSSASPQRRDNAARRSA